MINIRKLVAVDMALHGSIFIVSEFIIATSAGIALGIFLISRNNTLVGWYLISTGTNYIPLLIYALIIARNRSTKQETKYELDHMRTEGKRYGLGQFIILIPFLLLFLAPYQEMLKRRVDN